MLEVTVMATVRDILVSRDVPVIHVSEQQSVLEAASLMNANRIGCVVVTRGEKVVGIFTERDILTRVVAARRDPAMVQVTEVMSSPVACCTPDTSLDECVSTFTTKRHRHLPVVENGRLVGIISSGDIMARQVREHQTTIMYLKEYMASSTR
jgi:CBS domain-containing protein